MDKKLNKKKVEEYSMSKYNQVKKILEKNRQEGILAFYDELDDKKKEELEEQILGINFELINKLYQNRNETAKQNKIEPVACIVKDTMKQEELEHYAKIGREAIKQGKVAVCQMAGGQRNKTSDTMLPKAPI